MKRNGVRNVRIGFTLIELLVVVATIAVLAAIAIPNLLAAQVRSKVARVKSDLRTLAAGVEAYTADNSQPPLDWNVPRGDPMAEGMAVDTSGILHPGRADSSIPAGIHGGLTTPVAYLTNCWIEDPFVSGNSYESIPFDQQKYTYNWFGPEPVRGVAPNSDYLFQEWDRHYGAWRIGSLGPDRDFYHSGGSYGSSRIYNPTNGATSLGNIWRSQREPEVSTRPPLDLIIDPEN